MPLLVPARSIIAPPWFPRLQVPEGAEAVWACPDPLSPGRFLLVEPISGMWAVVEDERVLALHFAEGRDSDACAEAAEDLARCAAGESEEPADERPSLRRDNPPINGVAVPGLARRFARRPRRLS